MSSTFLYSQGPQGGNPQEERLFLNRTEMAALCRVSISSLGRYAQKDIWPFCAFVRFGRRMVYPVSLIKEMEDKARGHAGLEREAEK
jgi:hypothetical protein